MINGGWPRHHTYLITTTILQCVTAISRNKLFNWYKDFNNDNYFVTIYLFMATNNFGWCESQYHSGVAVFRHNEAYVSDTHRQLQIIRMQIEGEKYYNKSILVSESVLRSEKTQYYFIIRYQCDQSNKLNHSASSCCTVYVYIMIVMKTFFLKKCHQY